MVRMRSLCLLFCLASVWGCTRPAFVRPNETVIFYSTTGYLSQDTHEWVLPVHGWVYRPSLLSRNLNEIQSALGLDAYLDQPAERQAVHDRVAPFVADNCDGRRIPISLGGTVLAMRPSGEDGHFRDQLRVPEIAVPAISGDGEAVLYQAVCGPDDTRVISGRIHLVKGKGLSVVSDIDDTIRVANVNNTKLLLAGMFVEPYRAVPGMASVYAGWAERCRASFHYLSSSPAQLGRPLSDFIDEAGFPAGSVQLRCVQRDPNPLKMAMALMDASPEYKREMISQLLENLPERDFVLIGDSGENDPELYGEMARAFDRQVRLVLIRTLDCCADRKSPRYQNAFHDIPENRWILFNDGGDLKRLVPPATRERTMQGLPGAPDVDGVLGWRVDNVAETYQSGDR